MQKPLQFIEVLHNGVFALHKKQFILFPNYEAQSTILKVTELIGFFR